MQDILSEIKKAESLLAGIQTKIGNLPEFEEQAERLVQMSGQLNYAKLELLRKLVSLSLALGINRVAAFLLTEQSIELTPERVQYLRDSRDNMIGRAIERVWGPKNYPGGEESGHPGGTI